MSLQRAELVLLPPCQISFFGDSDGSFTKILGLEVDLNAAGLGPGMRSNRYSMLVEDGKITQMVCPPPAPPPPPS